MAFKLKTSILPNQSTKEVSLSDISGVYNSTTNPTGYGTAQTPVGFREISDINYGEWYILPYGQSFNFESSLVPTAFNIISTMELDSSEAQSLANGTSKIVDLSTNVQYSDGIYKSIYINWFNGVDVVSQQNPNTNIINFSSTEDFSNASYISIDVNGNNIYTNYEILSVDTVNFTLTINAKITIPEYSDVGYRVGYASTVYFQNVHDINKCLHTDVAKSACSDCACNKSKKEKLYTAVMDFFGIQPNMDRGNYKCAEEIINSITIYCSKSGCNC